MLDERIRRAVRSLQQINPAPRPIESALHRRLRRRIAAGGTAIAVVATVVGLSLAFSTGGPPGTIRVIAPANSTVPSFTPSTSVPSSTPPTFPAGSQARFRDLQAIGTSIVVAVGNGLILRSDDGGNSWSRDYSGDQTLTKVDLVDQNHGWAVGDSELLRTIDGRHWVVAGEPSGAMILRDVHFVSDSFGFGLATSGPAASASLYGTNDGGLNWVTIPTPVTPIGMSANSALSVWIAGSNSLWHSNNAGASWTKVLANVPAGPGGFQSIPYAEAHLQAAGPSNVWVEFDQGQGAASQRPWLLYGGGAGEQLHCVGAIGSAAASCPSAQITSSYPGIFSALSASQVAIITDCPACSTPEHLLVLTLNGKATLVGPIEIYGPTALSFATPDTGYLIAQARLPAVADSPTVIEVTHDGGHTWTAINTNISHG